MKAVERFKAKCEFQPGSGCVLWTGATSKSGGGKVRTPAFWDQGKRWAARRWAAIHIHGLEVGENVNVIQTCGEPLCVHHLKLENCDARNLERQNWLLESLGYGDPDAPPPPLRPDHGGVPFHIAPEWLR